MRLNNIDFIKLLPVWMQKELDIIGLAAGVDAVVKRAVSRFGALSIWDNIDALDEVELDELAWEMNLTWYKKDASIDTKRDLVRNGYLVWRTLGTKWAVETVITAYFGEGYIKEWFEYEGTPNHFSVYSTNPSVTNERVQEFLFILNKVKRYTARLDAIYITLSGEMPLSAGMNVHETSFESYAIGKTL